MWFARFPSTDLIDGMGFLITLVLALSGHQRAASYMMVITFWLYAGGMAVAIFGQIADAQNLWKASDVHDCYARGVTDLTYLVPFTVLAAGLSFASQKPMEVMLAFSLIHIATSSCRIYVLLNVFHLNPDETPVYNVFVGPQLLALAISLSIILLRQRALSTARRLVRKDKTQYDVAWAGVMSEAGVMATFDELKTLLARFRKPKGKVIRQMRPRCSSENEMQAVPTHMFAFKPLRIACLQMLESRTKSVATGISSQSTTGHYHGVTVSSTNHRPLVSHLMLCCV